MKTQLHVNPHSQRLAVTVSNPLNGDTVTLTRELGERHHLSALHVGNAPVYYGYDAEDRLAVTSNDAFTVAYALTADGWDAGYAVILTNGLTITRAVTRDMYRRHFIKTITNAVNGTMANALSFEHDLLGRITNRNADTFGYNARSEVTSADIGSTASRYAYDSIGNRVWSAFNAVTNTYAANSLNQYSNIVLQSYSLQPYSLSPSYDSDGNMTRLGGWYHTWDAENRLWKAMPVNPTNGSERVVNGYDHRNRRVLKRVEILTGAEPVLPPSPPGNPGEWVEVRSTVFVWDNDRIAAEITSYTNGVATTNAYFWGADMSGTADGAAGVGGLVRASLNGSDVLYCYDAHGNVTELVDAYSGAVVARYRYGVFGGTIRAEGSLAAANPWRFATRYYDGETGLVMFPRRPYSPGLGRFLSRDPIGVNGGLNEYGFVSNDPVNRADYLGLLEKKIIPLSLSFENLSGEAGKFSANESLICVCDPLGGSGKKKIKCVLLAMPRITLSSDQSVLDAAQAVSKYPDLSVEGHERNHYAVWLAQYVPKYEQLVAQYEGKSCCNCQKRIIDLHQNFQFLKAELNRIEHMLEYGWVDPSGKLVDYGGRVPWLDYGRDGDFLVDIPSPKEECE